MPIPTFTLLIVEDLATDRELYRRALNEDSSCIYHLLEAESVAAGLALCRDSIIDAILLDYALPNEDGLAFLVALDTQSNGSSPPVVMLTGLGDQRIAVRAMKLGAEDYLVKSDLTPELLRSTMRMAIENTRLRLQLQQSNERLRISIDTMLDCYGTYTAIRDARGEIIDFRFDYLNAAALESNQMTAADMSRSLCEVFPAVRETGLFEKYCQVVATGVPLVQEELIYTDVFGTQQLTKVYDVRINKLDDGFMATWRDITAQKQAQLALQAKNQQIATIWESMTDAYVTIDRDWRIVYANSAAIEVFSQLVDLAPEEFLGKTQWEIFPWSVGSILDRQYRRAVTEQVAVHFEIFYAPAQVWFELHAYPSEIGLGIYFRDITDRKQIEAALTKSERKFNAIFNQTFQLIGLVSLDGVLLEANQAALNSVAAPKSEIIGKSFWEAPWWQTEQLQQQLRDAIATAASGQFVRYEVEFPNPSGGVMITEFSLKPMFNEVGQVESIVAEGHDITERKQAQADLEQRNQDLNSFVYIVSHDLKAPLRGIANLSEWLEEDLEGFLSIANQHQMRLLRSRVYRIQATVDGLLDYARIGIAAGTVESVSIAELLADVIDSIAPPPTFTISLPPELPILSTRRLPLFQVFANLIGNGIKHHHSETGSIQISIAKRATKAVEDRGDCYEFAVSDNGPGIAPQHHDRMFKIFQAVNPQNRSDSTGIGLAIVKKIVEAEGGRIWLESELGRGTTFYFTWLQR